MAGRSNAPLRKPGMTTLPADIDVEWNELVDAVRPVGRAGGLRDLANLWRASRDREVLILRGSVALRDRYGTTLWVLLGFVGILLASRAPILRA